MSVNADAPAPKFTVDPQKVNAFENIRTFVAYDFGVNMTAIELQFIFILLQRSMIYCVFRNT